MQIPEIDFHLIPHFLQSVSASYPNIAWIYRGESSCARTLIPKAGRPQYFLAPFDESDQRLRGYPPRDICRFNYWRELSVAYGRQLPSNDFECLALAQHYGLATRLLDWSENPLVAAYFAVDSCSKENGAVYCYRPKRVIIAKDAKLGVVPEVAKYTPPPFDQRILLQAGIFTYHPNPSEPLNAGPVHDLGRLTPSHGLDLVRFVIRHDLKPIIKRDLSEIGFNRKSLFPDLEGLSAWINWETETTAHPPYADVKLEDESD